MKKDYVDIQDIKLPKLERISNLELLSDGINILPEDKLQLFDDKKFEKFIESWAYSCKKSVYQNVKRSGGANDKGIDIICNQDSVCHIYQCKKYKTKLAPTDMYPDFAKLVYYTYKGFYKIPEKYYIVSTNGVGPKLSALLTNKQLGIELINNWEDYCKTKITKNENILLTDDLKKYINSFNFDIVSELNIKKVIEEFESSKYYTYFFGIKILKRPPIQNPPNTIQANESAYTRKLLDAYQSADQSVIKDSQILKPNYKKHFEYQRNCFYSAESLKVFTERSFYDERLFKNFQNQILVPVESSILIKSYKNGLEKLNDAIEISRTTDIKDHPLQNIITSLDKIGVLHQNANDEEDFRWVND